MKELNKNLVDATNSKYIDRPDLEGLEGVNLSFKLTKDALEAFARIDKMTKPNIKLVSSTDDQHYVIAVDGIEVNIDADNAWYEIKGYERWVGGLGTYRELLRNLEELKKGTVKANSQKNKEELC